MVFSEFNGGQDMLAITPEQHLEYAADHAGQTVLGKMLELIQQRERLKAVLEVQQFML